MTHSLVDPLLPTDTEITDESNENQRRRGGGSLSNTFKQKFGYFQVQYILPGSVLLANVLFLLISINDRLNNHNGGNNQRMSSSVFLGNEPSHGESDGGDSHGETDGDHGSDSHGSGEGAGGHGEGASSHGANISEHDVMELEHEIPHVVLFPWFALLVGIFAYYLISRVVHFIPYTAVMFITGATMGFFVPRVTSDNAIRTSTSLWLGINGEVILLTFLPGLLYLDSYNINVHLFVQAFWQLFTFAFPMVLGGTALTALVAYYLFPYGWSFDLCMTFGSILAATDPVAVAVLLNELGAPPRLKIHISGESLMNDGSAVVFYNIFSSRFFYELGVHDFGEDIGWGKGFELFFRLSLGGACIGVAFGMALVYLLYKLNRRLSTEENVIQVTATITTAYLVFYVSEILCHCSGIIAVLFCGLTSKAFGEVLLNDPHLTHDFWHIAEHLLNTTLFTLGGAVWGQIISDSSSTEGIANTFKGIDYLYLLMLFALVTVIRFVLIFLFYPLTSNIGIGQSWREAVFMSYGGLRGAVGIALSLALNAEIFEVTEAVDEGTRIEYREYVDRVFALVGGIAFLTLVVNGPTSGPLLKKLGLVTPTETREKIVHNYEHHMKINTLVEFVALLSQKRFEEVDYSVVKQYVSPLSNITQSDLNIAVAKFKRTHPGETPNVKALIDHLSGQSGLLSTDDSRNTPPPSRPGNFRSESVANIRKHQRDNRGTVYDYGKVVADEAILEERLVFIDLLRREYHRQIDSGELEPRGFMAFSLLQSLDFAQDAADHGHPLNDWSASQTAGDLFSKRGDYVIPFIDLCCTKKDDGEFHIIKTKVLQALSFIKAHESAREIFKAEFASPSEQSLTLAEKTVLDESKEQVALADSMITQCDDEDLRTIKSQYVCQILLHKSANYFEKLAHHGLMSEKEANEFLEKYDHELRRLRSSTDMKTNIRRMTQTQPTGQAERGIQEGIAAGSVTPV